MAGEMAIVAAESQGPEHAEVKIVKTGALFVLVGFHGQKARLILASEMLGLWDLFFSLSSTPSQQEIVNSLCGMTAQVF